MNATVVDEIIEQLKSLPYELQWRVLEFTRALALSVPRGVPGHRLLRFAGAIPLDDVQRMRQAIEWGANRLMSMSGKYPLDTSVIIALFADDAAVKKNLEKADETFIPCIAIGELYYGAWKSARIRENVARIDEFSRRVTWFWSVTVKRPGFMARSRMPCVKRGVPSPK